MTIYIGGAAAMFVCLALILARCRTSARSSAGAGHRSGRQRAWRRPSARSVSKWSSAVVLISFVSCVLSLQAAASRLIYSYGRDGMIFGQPLWQRFDETRHVPSYALLVGGWSRPADRRLG